MNNKVSVVKCDRYSEVQNDVENAAAALKDIGLNPDSFQNILKAGQRDKIESKGKREDCKYIY